MTNVSASKRLDRGSFVMRLWKRSKTDGVWDPEAIDFTQDRQDWLAMTCRKQERLLQLCSLFQAGEQAVIAELLPLISVVAAENRLDEAMYLASFLWEEAKHVDLFSRFFDEIAVYRGDPSQFHHAAFSQIVDDELSESLRRLGVDASPEAQVRASVTYNIVVEGVLADTGYYAFHRMLVDNGVMPGMQRAARLLRRDESRHIAFGVYFLKRLIIEHGNVAYKAFLDRMGELKPIVEESTRQFMSFFTGDHAFGVEGEELIRYSQQRFASRVQSITRARCASLVDLNTAATSYLADEFLENGTSSSEGH